MRVAERRELARALSMVENRAEGWRAVLARCFPLQGGAAVIGVTGPPGSGKSTLIDGLAFHWAQSGEKVGVIAVDPSSPFSGGALLGDRLRMHRSEALDNVFIRSISARGHPGGLSEATIDLCALLAGFGVKRVLLETVGAGQNEIDVAFVADCVVVVAVPGLGDAVQAAKAGLVEIGDIHVVNKADLSGADAVRCDIERMLALVFPGRPGSNDGVSSARASAKLSEKAQARFTAGDQASATHVWHPLVTKAIATEQPMIAAIADAIDRFVDWSRATGLAHERQKARAAAHLQQIVKRRLLDEFMARTAARDNLLRDWASRIVEERLDPYNAAEHFLQGTGANARRMSAQES